MNWPARYAQRDEERKAQVLTAPSGGPSIYRTRAANTYNLAARDLDSILPVSREPNYSHGGIGDVRLYNECDVQALADRLRPTFGPDEETESDGGPEIDGIQAMKQYNLKFIQLKRIKPCRKTPYISPKTKREGFIRFYNVSDVEALHDRIEAAAAAPVGVPIPRPKEEDDDETFKEEETDYQYTFKEEAASDDEEALKEEADDSVPAGAPLEVPIPRRTTQRPQKKKNPTN